MSIILMNYIKTVASILRNINYFNIEYMRVILFKLQFFYLIYNRNIRLSILTFACCSTVVLKES